MARKSDRQGTLGDALMKAAQGAADSETAKKIVGSVTKDGSETQSAGIKPTSIPKHWKPNTTLNSRRGKKPGLASSRTKAGRLGASATVKPGEVVRVEKRNGVTFTWTRRVETQSKATSGAKSHASLGSTNNQARSGNMAAQPRSGPDLLRWNSDTKIGDALNCTPEAFPFAGFRDRWQSWIDDPEGTVDLVIGLDFGTAFTKVVISEPGGQRSWAVPLSTNTNNPYLLKSEVYLADGKFNLAKGDKHFSGLKIPFLFQAPTPSENQRVVAFLAGVITYAKQWMLNEQRAFLAGLTPSWWLHVGLPAKDFEDKSLLDWYRTTTWAAFTLAAAPSELLTAVRVRKALARAILTYKKGEKILSVDTGITTHIDQVDVYPEIMAQMYGFLRSRDWDPNKPEFMLVDVGGGTLDSTIFNVVKDKDSGELRFWMFLSRVERMGALELHRQRLVWILREFERQEAGSTLTESIRNLIEDQGFWLVPDRIDSYLENADFGSRNLDEDFVRTIRGAIFEEQLKVLLERINPGFLNQGRPYSLILAGGGSRNRLFQRAVEQKSVFRNVGITLQKLSRPRTLIGDAITADTYDRVSVAYGLSFDNLGEIITPENIKDYWIDGVEGDGARPGNEYIEK